eukprot:jgi/Psemu1/46351/gm1.46351_g
MESKDADDTPIPMLRILGRNESSGTITTAISLHNPGADDEADNGNADDDKVDDEADIDATSTSKSNSNNN